MAKQIDQIIKAMSDMGADERKLYIIALGCLACRLYAACDYGQKAVAQPSQLLELFPGVSAQGEPETKK